MNTIHAFGDSYIAGPFGDFTGWAGMLATDMNMSLKNLGMPGSSTQYSFKKFMENKHNFQNGDIVLFSFSAIGRVHFEFQNTEPTTASQYFRISIEDTFYEEFFKHLVPESSIKRIWYDENKDHIDWYVRNRDLELEKINDTAYRNLLKMESIDNPGIKYIVSQLEVRSDWKDFKTQTSNYLEIPLSLREISYRELDNTRYPDFVELIKDDPRKNHMSIKNLKILSGLIQESLTTCSTRNFTHDQFEQKIFRPILTHADYDYYINSGHLYDFKRARERLR